MRDHMWAVGWCELIEAAAHHRKEAARFPIGSAWHREHVSSARASVRIAARRRDQAESYSSFALVWKRASSDRE